MNIIYNLHSSINAQCQLYLHPLTVFHSPIFGTATTFINLCSLLALSVRCWCYDDLATPQLDTVTL